MTKPVLGTVAVLIAAAAVILYFAANSDPETSADTARQSETAEAAAPPENTDRTERPTEVIAAADAADDFDPEIPRHGSSLFGELKYGPDFRHFDYVNPEAPKGGEVRYGAFGSFDSLNGFIVKGQAAAGINLIYDTLMTSSLDEPASEYGLVAESVRHPKDFSSVTYTLRPQARWHDGEKITPDDVIWTFETLKKNHPFYNAYYANVVNAEKTAEHEVTFTFNQTGNRELPLIVGQLPVLPEHYWTGKTAKGEQRVFSETTLEPPLGSGPYRIADVSPGRSITYERVADYWAKDLPVNVGTNNFGKVRFEYYRDTTVALQALKGDRVDFRMENSAKDWATEYDVASVRKGNLIKAEIPDENAAGMQSFAFNIRRGKFQDPRVREAFNWAFDFEWMNKNLFYGQYRRTDSYFANSELASGGLPEGRELTILKEHEESLPPEIFTEPYEVPKTDGSGNNRANLRKATRLLEEAGWTVKDGKLTNSEGEVMTVEFLIGQPTFERVVAPYIQSLKRLGIAATIRPVDTAQYQNRVDNRDFDIIVQTFPQSLSPGNEQRDFWGCDAAEAPGSRNVIGICDPVIEKLIDRVIYATSRKELIAATHALDRVLLAGHYVVPQWHLSYHRLAYWSRLKHPENMPPYSTGFPAIWWMDKEAPTPAPKPDEAE
ncbi:extracellular solute-binding protein [Parvibaculum sp.]|uniref:extracellular solute-binding protein n=1 Tax=Parvibaculum sp. TaxID=2024848 RepID=UPI001B0F2A45|nr:extracellular solute-binding protein [Parvibaculum sp.]MBO6635340.1 ABC transporter substrate-binding protein [Parvibaculum sp.]MBO6677874.1 ABC transporter substrate-binding protein [Parvibaculum sp.]MBO6684729.1 ABC transporter substrate-binding protein [Parvibaculum sp.]MBO6903809.1 ABC transporter substrate-binding protein [Parvibaculum sp.]